MKKIAIIGSGSWGVALAIHLASIGNKVKIWSYEEEEKRLINEEKRCMFLPNVTIPENIECSNDFKEVIEDAEFILHVTPSKFTRSTFKQYKQYVDIAKKLEQGYKDVQDMEFTIEKGKLYILQTRNGKRTAKASVRIAVEMAEEGIISKERAIELVDPNQLYQVCLLYTSPSPRDTR